MPITPETIERMFQFGMSNYVCRATTNVKIDGRPKMVRGGGWNCHLACFVILRTHSASASLEPGSTSRSIYYSFKRHS